MKDKVRETQPLEITTITEGGIKRESMMKTLSKSCRSPYNINVGGQLDSCLVSANEIKSHISINDKKKNEKKLISKIKIIKRKSIFRLSNMLGMIALAAQMAKSQIPNLTPFTSQQVSLGSYSVSVNSQSNSLIQVAKKIPTRNKMYLTYFPNTPFAETNMAIIDLESNAVIPVTFSEILDEDTVILEIEFNDDSSTSCKVMYAGYTHNSISYTRLDLSTMSISLGEDIDHISTSFKSVVEWDDLPKFLYSRHTDVTIHPLYRGEPELSGYFSTNARDLRDGFIHSSRFMSKTSDSSVIEGSVGYFFDDETDPVNTFFWQVTVNNKESVLEKLRFDDPKMLPLEIVPASDLGFHDYETSCSNFCKFIRVAKIGKDFGFVQSNGINYKMIGYDTLGKLTINGDFPASIEPSSNFFLKAIDEGGVYLASFSIVTFTPVMQSDVRGMIDSYFYLADPSGATVEIKDVTSLFNDIRSDFGAGNKKHTRVISLGKTGEILLLQDPATNPGTLQNVYLDLVQIMPLKCHETCATNQCSAAGLKNKCLSCADVANMDFISSTCTCKSASPIFEPSTQTCISTCSNYLGTIGSSQFCLTKEEAKSRFLSTRDSTMTFLTVDACKNLGDGSSGPCFDPLTYNCLEGPNTVSSLRPNVGENICIDQHYCTKILGYTFADNQCMYFCPGSDEYLTPDGNCITKEACLDYSDPHGELYLPYISIETDRKLCVRKLNCAVSDNHAYFFDDHEVLTECIHSDYCLGTFSLIYLSDTQQFCFKNYNVSALYQAYHAPEFGWAFSYEYCSYIFENKRITVGPNIYPHFCVNQQECLELTDMFRWSSDIDRCVQKEVCLFEDPISPQGYCRTSCPSGQVYDSDVGQCIEQAQCTKQVMFQTFTDDNSGITINSGYCVNQQSCASSNDYLVKWNLDQSTCTKYDQCWENHLVNPNTCNDECSDPNAYQDLSWSLCYTSQGCLADGKFPVESSLTGERLCNDYYTCEIFDGYKFSGNSKTCLDDNSCSLAISGNDYRCETTSCPVTDGYLHDGSSTCYSTVSCLLKDPFSGTSYAVSEGKKRCYSQQECQDDPDFVYNLDMKTCMTKEDCFLVDGQGVTTCRYRCPAGTEYFHKATRTCYDATCGGDASKLKIDDPTAGKFCITSTECKGFLEGKYVLKSGSPDECITKEACVALGSVISSGECLATCPPGFDFQHSSSNACYDETCGNNPGLFKFEDGSEKSCLDETQCLAKGPDYILKKGTSGECITIEDCVTIGHFIWDNSCVEYCHGFLPFGDLENRLCVEETCLGDPTKLPVDTGHRLYCLTEQECENSGIADLVLVMTQPKQCILKQYCKEDYNMFVYGTKCVSTCPSDFPYANLESNECQDATCGGDSSLITADTGTAKYCLSETSCVSTPIFSFLLKETSPKECVTKSQCSSSNWVESDKKCQESCQGALAFINTQEKRCYSQSCGLDLSKIPFENGADKRCLTKEECINEGHLFQTELPKGKCVTREDCESQGMIRAQTECTAQCPSYLTYRAIGTEACYDETCGGDEALFKIITITGERFCVTQEQCNESILGTNLVFLPGSCVTTQECHEFNALTSDGFCVKKCPEGKLVAPNELECVTPDKCPDGAGDLESGKCIGASIKNEAGSQGDLVDKSKWIASFCTNDVSGIPCYMGLIYDVYLRCLAPFIPSMALNSVTNFNVFISQSYQRLTVASKMGFWGQDGRDYFYAETFKDWLGEISKGLMSPTRDMEIAADCEKGNSRYCEMGLSRNLIVNGFVVVLAIVFITVTTLCKGADTGARVGEVVDINSENIEDEEDENTERKDIKGGNNSLAGESTEENTSRKETGRARTKPKEPHRRESFIRYKLLPFVILSSQPTLLFYMVSTLLQGILSTPAFVLSFFVSMISLIIITIAILGNCAKKMKKGKLTNFQKFLKKTFEIFFGKLFDQAKPKNAVRFLAANFVYDLIMGASVAIFPKGSMIQGAIYGILEVALLVIFITQNPFAGDTKKFRIIMMVIRISSLAQAIVSILAGMLQGGNDQPNSTNGLLLTVFTGIAVVQMVSQLVVIVFSLFMKKSAKEVNPDSKAGGQRNVVRPMRRGNNEHLETEEQMVSSGMERDNALEVVRNHREKRRKRGRKGTKKRGRTISKKMSIKKETEERLKRKQSQRKMSRLNKVQKIKMMMSEFDGMPKDEILDRLEQMVDDEDYQKSKEYSRERSEVLEESIDNGDGRFDELPPIQETPYLNKKGKDLGKSVDEISYNFESDDLNSLSYERRIREDQEEDQEESSDYGFDDFE